MFQNFAESATPEQGPARLAALRALMAREGFQGFFVPRFDAHQGEDVAPRDRRLAWLSGFTGSAGFAIVLEKAAGVFIDGRYRTQVKLQVDLDHFTPVPWPETGAAEWLLQEGAQGRIGYDPWLHSDEQMSEIEEKLKDSGISLCPCSNFIDTLWEDQPPPPCGPARVHPLELAGETSAAKRARLGGELTSAGQKAALITLPDSLAWLLNIRGSDIERTPVVHGFAILHADGRLALFTAPEKFTPDLLAHLGPEVSLAPPAAFLPALAALEGPVRIDRATAPILLSQHLRAAGVAVEWGDDPCRLPKACKNAAEIEGMRAAHLRDAAAMVEFLADFSPRLGRENLTEIDIVKALEERRRATNALEDISFESIVGTGPHGAIMHYRVTEKSNRAITPNSLLLIDSGAQYFDGTTDITRTLAVGDPGEEVRRICTFVLRGLIALSRARFAEGRAGRDLDALARMPLWQEGLDYNHGTGHGVGAALSVHEGPARINANSTVPLREGMILSNEPGYYREGAFGVRQENLIVVTRAPEKGEDRPQFVFETLTQVPFDRKLILAELLSAEERAWLNAYHAALPGLLKGRLSPKAEAWLAEACAPI